jgi:hypothetical protein
MKGRRRKNIFRPCAHCGRRFLVNPRAGRRQRFCSEPECRRASHLQADKKWRRSRKGREYFKGWVNADHVRTWREEHPEYWRRRLRLDGLTGDEPLASALRELALQDSIDTPLSLVIGLIADRLNLALQDTIAFELRRLMLLGHGILAKFKFPESSRGKRLR